VTDPLAPIPVEGAISKSDADLYGDYRHLVPITVGGTRRLVPEDNSVLRVLQYLEVKERCVRLEWGKYCWNDTQGCCQIMYRPEPGARTKSGRACTTTATPGLEIVQLPPGGRCVGVSKP